MVLIIWSTNIEIRLIILEASTAVEYGCSKSIYHLCRRKDMHWDVSLQMERLAWGGTSLGRGGFLHHHRANTTRDKSLLVSVVSYEEQEPPKRHLRHHVPENTGPVVLKSPSGNILASQHLFDTLPFAMPNHPEKEG